MTTKKKRTPTTAVRALIHHGVPEDVAWAARDAAVARDVPLARLIAVAEAESAFRNVWGHDKGKWRENGPLTPESVRRYYSAPASARPNGAGVWQLTDAGLQERAEQNGGLADIEAQAMVSANLIASLPDRGATAAGIARYNGSGPLAAAYGRRVHLREATWAVILKPGSSS